MAALPEGLEPVLARYRAGHSAFANGDPAPMKSMWSRSDDTTLLGGWGAYARGWAEIDQRLDWASARFAGGTVEIENVSVIASPDLAYIVDMERYRVRLAGSDDIRPTALRTTSIFRRETDGWKLVHRHADHVSEVEAAETLVPKG